jgi:hypothetical protein
MAFTDLNDVRRRIELEPTRLHTIGDPIYRRGTSEIVGMRRKSLWLLSSETLGITSKDTNRHIDALCEALGPWREDIERWSATFDVAFNTWLSSTRAFAGDGPYVEVRNLKRIAAFGAALGCNVICEADHLPDPEE